MGWAERANTKSYDAPKQAKKREHFKRPEFKAQWAQFSERVGVHMPSKRIRQRAVKAIKRIFRYRRRVA